MNADRIRGCLLGTAVGDALGMPVEGWTREAIKERVGRIEGYLDSLVDEMESGQWTDDTQFTFALADVLAEGVRPDLPERVAARYTSIEARRAGPSTRQAIDRLEHGDSWKDSGRYAAATNGAAMRAAPFGVLWAANELSKEEAFDLMRPVMEITHGHPASVVAAFGQAFAVRRLLLVTPSDLDIRTFSYAILEMVDWAERIYDHVDHSLSRRLGMVLPMYSASIDDLLAASGGAGLEADAAWPFALKMFSLYADDPAGCLFETVSAGGDTDTTGAMAGALVGALHGWSRFPNGLRTGLEDVGQLLDRTDAFIRSLGTG